MVKTVTLAGNEVKVDGLEGFYATVHNMSGEAVYASSKPNIRVGADYVAEIPAGAAKMVTLTRGAVYLLGAGKVELMGQDHEFVNFSQSSSGNANGTGDVTKEYVDGALNAAKEEIEQTLSESSDMISANAKDIAALQNDKADKSELAETLSSAKTYTNEQTAELRDTKADKSELAETLNSAKDYTNEKIAELRDAKTDKSEISAASNPNLLDNWYFADPINQRAETTYGGSQSGTYAIDRWSIMRGTLTVLDGKIKIETTNASSTNGVLFQQSIETHPKEKVTFSVLFGDGELATYTNVIDTAGYNSGYIFQNNTVALELGVYNNIPNVRIRQVAVNGTKCELIAAKLEIGDVQTLARKEGDTWVLSDTPPNKALELTRCQRYFQVFATESLRPTKAQDFRPTMYKEPTLGTISVGGTTYYTANAEI